LQFSEYPKLSRKKEQGKGRGPERQGIIMLADIGDKLLRQLASRIKLSQVPYNGTPDHFPANVGLGGR